MSHAKPPPHPVRLIQSARRSRRWLVGALCAVVLLGGLWFGALTLLVWSAGHIPRDVPTPTEPGQYVATSADLLGMVSVRLVFQDRGRLKPALVFVEVNALFVPGLDRETLAREGRAALEAQGVPDKPSPGSEPRTARLVHSALARAFGAPNEPVASPNSHGAADHRAPTDFYGMWPSEFGHRCAVDGLADGDYPGTGSNPVAPISVILRMQAGHIRAVTPTATPVSPTGQGAIQTLLPRFVAQDRVDIDILSGATQTSYALRSAVFQACTAGRGPIALSPGMKPPR